MTKLRRRRKRFRRPFPCELVCRILPARSASESHVTDKSIARHVLWSTTDRHQHKAAIAPNEGHVTNADVHSGAIPNLGKLGARLSANIWAAAIARQRRPTKSKNDLSRGQVFYAFELGRFLRRLRRSGLPNEQDCHCSKRD